MQSTEVTPRPKATQEMLLDEKGQVHYDNDLESHKIQTRTILQRTVSVFRLCVEHLLAFALGFIGTAIILFLLAIGLNLLTGWWLMMEPAVHLIFVNVTYGPRYAVSHAWSVIEVDWEKLKSTTTVTNYCREVLHQMYLQSRN